MNLDPAAAIVVAGISIDPNTTGLPGIAQLRTLVGAVMTVGLILATSLVMSRAADHDWRAYTVTALCTVIFLVSKINPLFVVAAAGVVGYLGFI